MYYRKWLSRHSEQSVLLCWLLPADEQSDEGPRNVLSVADEGSGSDDRSVTRSDELVDRICAVRPPISQPSRTAAGVHENEHKIEDVQ